MAQFKLFQEERPWGSFRQFTHDSPSTVKIIFVKKGEAFSLQYHNKRTEFWRIISGHPIVTIGEKKMNASPQDEFEIKVGELHRIEATDEDAQILEISSGEFDENDIVRIEDKYGRI